ncbi:MAG TPA: YkgJ family cysteine cluster protein [Verrucomicrobiae bacterium]|nr:YkgJ family cysteine cluster protein [Verrucomicrobiae bacterium]
MECRRCGTCCVAPDISTLGKPAGVRCPHLGEDGLCAAYDRRPPVCRGYRPDELCLQVAADTLEERVENYLALFGVRVRGKGDR